MRKPNPVSAGRDDWSSEDWARAFRAEARREHNATVELYDGCMLLGSAIGWGFLLLTPAEWRPGLLRPGFLLGLGGWLSLPALRGSAHLHAVVASLSYNVVLTALIYMALHQVAPLYTLPPLIRGLGRLPADFPWAAVLLRLLPATIAAGVGHLVALMLGRATGFSIE